MPIKVERFVQDWSFFRAIRMSADNCTWDVIGLVTHNKNLCHFLCLIAIDTWKADQ